MSLKSNCTKQIGLDVSTRPFCLRDQRYRRARRLKMDEVELPSVKTGKTRGRANPEQPVICCTITLTMWQTKIGRRMPRERLMWRSKSGPLPWLSGSSGDIDRALAGRVSGVPPGS
jgi:hypothetical protein